jgi:hypothetical protein
MSSCKSLIKHNYKPCNVYPSQENGSIRIQYFSTRFYTVRFGRCSLDYLPTLRVDNFQSVQLDVRVDEMPHVDVIGELSVPEKVYMHPEYYAP